MSNKSINEERILAAIATAACLTVTGLSGFTLIRPSSDDVCNAPATLGNSSVQDRLNGGPIQVSDCDCPMGEAKFFLALGLSGSVVCGTRALGIRQSVAKAQPSGAV
jgi:hypothetical protein